MSSLELWQRNRHDTTISTTHNLPSPLTSAALPHHLSLPIIFNAVKPHHRRTPSIFSLSHHGSFRKRSSGKLPPVLTHCSSLSLHSVITAPMTNHTANTEKEFDLLVPLYFWCHSGASH
ncbi:hypothetical protein K7X08_013504 [Anisodus acutangulus]|uniref:Uncharacterized protein n=1 Tax=Anisodus acutangulus TaxID=402998 RepID=A0A9Q1LKF4_9SOLA|nr:hypothetical protein K7X08_013504 [Anisodus acutangulus]